MYREEGEGVGKNMVLRSTIQTTLSRYQSEINEALHRAVPKVNATAVDSRAADLQTYYGQMQYHLGWVDADFSPIENHPGKLLRPTLLLLAYEVAGAWGLAVSDAKYLRRALPAAAAVELTHNFTLIHDDIEDSDAERRHRPTLWKLWGIPHAINTGDGLFALARLTLWSVLDEGVEGDIAARLGAVLDLACLVLSEGQYLDISFEEQLSIPVATYVDMISRKTAALMGCAAEMGAMLGTRDQETIERLRKFGYAMGVAFQVRDDLLGVWATTAQLGKTPSGDIYRRKKSLPFLHALEHANTHDRQLLREVYEQESAMTGEQVEEVLAVFARTETKAFCCAFLAEQCRLAHESLASVPRLASPSAARAINDMETLVQFVEETARS
ncbi:MAG: polyprenyl synthetase family protein [Ktedonobacteraceae bacterium]